MIIFFNQNKDQVFALTEYNLEAGAEYALGLINSAYSVKKVNNNLNYTYSVSHQFPQWIIDETRTNSEAKIIDFVQELYNFLFSSSGLNLTPNYENIQDIYLTDINYLKEYYNSLFSDFDFNDFDDTQALRDFLISNKTRFIGSKGTEDSYKYFIKTFFNAELDDYSLNYGNDTMTLNGGSLNETYLTNGIDKQERSILLQADIPEKYEDDLKSLLKPMGFYFNLVRSEKTVISTTITASEKLSPYSIVLS
jgi:hypothetical protein